MRESGKFNFSYKSITNQASFWSPLLVEWVFSVQADCFASLQSGVVCDIFIL